MKPASDELLKLAQEMLPKRYIFRPNIHELNEWVIEDLNVRVFPTQMFLDLEYKYNKKEGLIKLPLLLSNINHFGDIVSF
jgi:hypothetical protein